MSRFESVSCTSSSSCCSRKFKNEDSIPLVFSRYPGYGTGLFSSIKTVFQFKTNKNKILYRSDSMVSVSYKTLVNYIYDDNYEEFCTFINNKRIIIDDKDENGATALHFAVSCGKLRFVRELLNHGADSNIPDCDNWCPLALAAKEGYTDICLLLIDHNADLEHKDMGAWTALMWACYKGREETVVALVNRGADVNACGNHHVTALMWATGRGYTNIAKFLVSRGAKVTIRDKFGTTALIWAARRGDLELTKYYIENGATIDASGMYCWTPLIVATMGNHIEVVELLLDYKANVNCTDKDGCSALTIACREGFYDNAIALLDAGAYINVQDKTRDSNLIYAVKNGHRSIVEALLKRYADVNIVGRDNKTAVFCAVEKGNTAILKLLIDSKPDLEIPAKDGDTPMLRAVRYHNYAAVKMLQEAGAKVDVRDKRGDNPLHISIRARSKTITELLINDVRNAHLLNCPNNIGETPYQIDYDDEKPIMHQIYGARAMNSNADNENNLGYDLYSCALAAILSEPDLSMPITIGLYAKWGSGKSFLLNKVTEEMKNFSRQWLIPMFEFQWLLAIIILHLTLFIGVIFAIITKNWIYGLSVFGAVSLFFYCWLLLIYYVGTRIKFLYSLNLTLTQKMKYVRIILQILFCHPPGQGTSGPTVVPIKYYFANQSKVTTTSAGENIIVNIIGTLFDAIEFHHGTLPTRLYRAFTPKPVKRHSSWKWRRLCCIPNILLFELNLISILLVSIIYTSDFSHNLKEIFNDTTKRAILTSCVIFVTFCIATNLYTCTHIFKALMFTQRTHLQKAISSLETVKSEGFMEALRAEVLLLINMVRCLDSFTKQQSRLVVIVDGLDSCEQDKVLLVLDTVNVLFSETDTPFIIFLSIDPFIISKMIEVNSRKLLSETNIGGHDYLRNLVQLPFYLQNSNLRRVRVAQKCSIQRKSFSTQIIEKNEDQVMNRRLSNESSGINNNEKLKPPSGSAAIGLSMLTRNAKGGSRKLKLSESIASSIASNLNRVGGAQDLTHMLCSDDYFSEVNPRSMRRLMNVACVTGRLLKSFQIEFNWYHLASWVNITEQWPYRTTCLILYHDAHEETLEDSMTLKSLYDKIRAHLPVSKEVEPLLEFDRDEKKFNIFLKYHRSSLQVVDLRIFLPFTINLDPHIKRIIKEKQQKLEDTTTFAYNTSGDYGMPWVTGNSSTIQPENSWFNPRKMTTPFLRRESRTPSKPPLVNPVLHQPSLPQPYVPISPLWSNMQTNIGTPFVNPTNSWLYNITPKPSYPQLTSSFITEDISNIKLFSLNVDGVCNLLRSIKELQNSSNLDKYLSIIETNNIIGPVLFHCDLEELKKTMKMTFGDWELFKVLILSLREQQLTTIEPDDKNVKVYQNQQYHTMSNPQDRKGSHPKMTNSGNQDQTDNKMKSATKPSETEKQVSMEDQLICGALQTLNEEACEDVLEETEDTKSQTPAVDIPENESDTSDVKGVLKIDNMKTSETDAIILQQSNAIIAIDVVQENLNKKLEQKKAFNREIREKYIKSPRVKASKVKIISEIWEQQNIIWSSPQSPRWSPVCAIQNWFTNDVVISMTTDSASSTPTLIRRKSNNRDSLPFKRRSRPSSLLISKPEELEQMLTLEEKKIAHAAIIRSSSVDNGNLKHGEYSSLLVNYNDNSQLPLTTLNCVSTPILTITPAISGSICDESDNDDENTPLVTDVASSNKNLFTSGNKQYNSSFSVLNKLQSPCSLLGCETEETRFRYSTESLHSNPETVCSISCINERNSLKNSSNKDNTISRDINSCGKINEIK